MSDFDRLYLILHKVRGEPAFDVALRSAEMLAVTGDEWIIPTTGHTAHPFLSWQLDSLRPDMSGDGCYLTTLIQKGIKDPDWPSLPDHYRVSAEPRQVLTLSSLGFVPKGGNVTKRSLT